MAGESHGPTIIKRKKVVGGGGHHGGAWKVAYADFVTAMMAFFMLMWLLNATTEQQRKGLADYFAPTIPINRVSGGGSGALNGDSLLTAENLPESGAGVPSAAIGASLQLAEESDASIAAEVAALQRIEEALLGLGGESLLSERALRHIVTRLSDQGLIIELFDLPGAPLFDEDSTEARPVTAEIARVLAQLFGAVENDVAITGHLRARPILQRDNPIWTLSTGRAAEMRLMLEDGGLNPLRIVRLVGAGDRAPAVTDPTAPRNNRLEIVLLRSDL